MIKNVLLQDLTLARAEQEQDAFDASCRKLYRFLTTTHKNQIQQNSKLETG